MVTDCFLFYLLYLCTVHCTINRAKSTVYSLCLQFFHAGAASDLLAASTGSRSISSAVNRKIPFRSIRNSSPSSCSSSLQICHLKGTVSRGVIFYTFLLGPRFCSYCQCFQQQYFNAWQYKPGTWYSSSKSTKKVSTVGKPLMTKMKYCMLYERVQASFWIRTPAMGIGARSIVFYHSQQGIA
jgi:hypothetical protein